MSYAAGFADGEQDAHQDRKTGHRRTNDTQPRGEYQRGYLDGYRPRSPEWATRQPTHDMTSPYVTPTIRADAAAIVALLRGKTMTRDEIAAHFERSKTALDRAFAFAKTMQKIDFARVNGSCYWGHVKRIREIQAELAQAQTEREAERKAKARREFDPDSVPDMPVVRRIIPAGSVKAPATNAPRWIFEAA